MIINRKLLKIKIKKNKVESKTLEKHKNRLKNTYQISDEEASYFVFSGKIENQAYNIERQNINILTKSGKIIDVARASDQFNLEALSETVVKYYLCFPKE